MKVAFGIFVCFTCCSLIFYKVILVETFQHWMIMDYLYFLYSLLIVCSHVLRSGVIDTTTRDLISGTIDRL